MGDTVFPISLYEDLLPKLVAVLELTQQPEGMTNPQAKQKLLQATNAFKSAISQAKDFSINLPGGELTIEEQDDVIQLLESLREKKRSQLAAFSSRNVIAKKADAGDMKIEIDSVASTPTSS